MLLLDLLSTIILRKSKSKISFIIKIMTYYILYSQKEFAGSYQAKVIDQGGLDFRNDSYFEQKTENFQAEKETENAKSPTDNLQPKATDIPLRDISSIEPVEVTNERIETPPIDNEDDLVRFVVSYILLIF